MTLKDLPPHLSKPKQPDFAGESTTAPSTISTLSISELARIRSTDAMGNALTIVDPHQPDQPIIYANAAFYELTGYSENEIIGFNCRFLQGPLTNRDDIAKLKQAIIAELPIQITILNYRKDGTSFWNELTVRPIRDDSGIVTHFVGVQTEVSALKEAEAALRESEQGLRLALSSGALGSIQVKINEFGKLGLSDIFRNHFGLSQTAEVSLDDVFQAIHPEDRLRVLELHDLAISEGRGFQTEARVIWPDKSEHWLSLHASPAFDSLGQMVRLSGVTQDITTRKLDQAYMVNALREAEERADRDPLTGLLNHRAFQKRLQEESSRARREGSHLALLLLDIDDFKFFNDVYGYLEGDGALVTVAKALLSACRSYDTVARFGGDIFALIMPGAGCDSPSDIETRLRTALGEIKVQPSDAKCEIPINISIGASILSPLSISTDVLKRAEERLETIKTGGAAESEADIVRASASSLCSGFSMLDALVTAVDNKDRYTRTHSEDVMAYSLIIARALHLSEGELETVAVAALLHDVGKIGVPDSILRKPGKLTADEYEAMKQHPEMGAIMVAAVAGLEKCVVAVRHHHERWDGQGYPGKLNGHETPLIARLMAVADGYSAMTTSRPYRAGMSPDLAQSILRDGRGTQWDPDCVNAFLTALNNENCTPAVCGQSAKPSTTYEKTALSLPQPPGSGSL